MQLNLRVVQKTGRSFREARQSKNLGVAGYPARRIARDVLF